MLFEDTGAFDTTFMLQGSIREKSITIVDASAVPKPRTVALS